MHNTWVFSDPHYNHKNLVAGVTEWEDKSQCRPFETLLEHNKTLVNNINMVVKPDDTLWCLGDWAFGGLMSIADFRTLVHCKNIHLVLGNHDHHIRNDKTFDHIPTTTRRLFSSVQEKFIGKICGQYMTLDHYSHRVWDKGHHGAWMLYGHSHGTLRNYCIEDYNEETEEWGELLFKTMDVGMDTHPEFRPYHFDEIAALMKTKIPLLVDHHNQKTN